MVIETAELPRFDSPPVVETILGVFFRPLSRMTSAHQGILWEKCFRERFPKLEERAPIEEVRERFGDERATPVELQWRISGRPDTPRLWLMSEGGGHVLQMQPNALLANWLRVSKDRGYRPFDVRRTEFQEDLRRVHQFVQDHDLGQIVPTSCIVTYINHFALKSFDRLSPELAETVTAWQKHRSDDWLPDPDNVVFEIGYPMPDHAGRLNVKASPVFCKPGNEKVIRFELTARVTVDDMDLESAIAKMDFAHEWVVRGFVSITTEQKHHDWGRTR